MGILQRFDAWATKTAASYHAGLPARTINEQYVGSLIEFIAQTGYQFPGVNQTWKGDEETIDPTFKGYAMAGYGGNAIVFACMQARLSLFSEARFQFRRLQSGRPGELFGTEALARLERPWAGGTTGDLLARMMVSNDLAGNAFVVATAAGGAKVLRPDWVTMVLGSDRDPVNAVAEVDAELIAIVHHPGGIHAGNPAEVFLRGEFAHFAPIPDPLSPFRGMPWIAPVVREIQGDTGYTTHKLKFLENGATPNMVVSLDASIQQAAFDAWVDAMEKGHRGVANAYRTLYLGAGATATVVGANLQQMDFKTVQGAGETRIAAAAGVPPVVVGFSEGLQGSSLNAGNYSAARRRFADLTMRPLWRNAAGSLASIIQVPAGAELWYDDRDISFLQEDMKDAAEIMQFESLTIRQLTDCGFDPDAVVDAVTAGDLKRLRGKHTGLLSVQLQEPGATPPTRSVERSQRPEDEMRVEVHTHQPEVEAVMRQMADVMAATEQRAVIAEERASAAIEASTRALEALAERESPVVNVAAAAPLVIPAPIVENRVDAPVIPPAAVVVNIPTRQTVDIASLPPMRAKVKRDPQGRISGVTDE